MPLPVLSKASPGIHHNSFPNPLFYSQQDSANMKPPKINIFIISGRSGVGKSTITYEISHLLSQSSVDIPHIHIDGDALDFIHPRETNESSSNLMLMNLRSLLLNYFTYRRRSCGVVLISGCGMVLQCKEIERVVKDVCKEVERDDQGVLFTEVKVYGVILEAPDAVAETRLRQREVGSELERHLESSKRMAGVLDRLCGAGHESPSSVVRFSAETGSVCDIAGNIIEFVLKVLDRHDL